MSGKEIRTVKVPGDEATHEKMWEMEDLARQS